MAMTCVTGSRECTECAIGMKPIVLKTRSSESCIGMIRLTPEAEKVVRRLQSRTQLPLRQIISEIVIQAEPLIDIEISEM